MEKLEPTKKKISFGVKLAPDVIKEIVIEAKKLNMSQGVYIASLHREYMKRVSNDNS